MKFSLKNKEFNKKRLNIFDRKQSPSPKFKSLPKQSLSKSKSPLQKYSKHNVTVSYDEVKTNMRQGYISKSYKPNINELDLSQILQENGQLINSNASNSENNLIKTKNKFFTNEDQDQQKKIRQNIFKRNTISPLSKPIQSVYHEQQKSMRQNWLIKNTISSISQNTINHPSKQIVFQPIKRKSKSKQQSKQNQHLNNRRNQTQIEHKLVKQYNYIIQGNNLQRNQKIITNQQMMTKVRKKSEVQAKDNCFVQEMKQLKQTIQQQNLQIKYLKNQKQIMESNQILQYDSKVQNYKKINQKSPSKHNNNKQLKAHQKQQQTDKLLNLYHILVQNQNKIKIMESHQKSLQASVLIYIQKIQDKLIGALSIKYIQYKNQLNQRLKQFDKYIDKCCALQEKLNLYSNTVRSVNQSLRITKLKQQNIELQIKQSKMRANYICNQTQIYNKSPQYMKPQRNDHFQPQNSQKNQTKFCKVYQNLNNHNKIPDSQSDISSIKRVQYDYDEFQQKQEHKQLYALSKNLQGNNNSILKSQQSISSFLDEKYSHLVYQKKNNPLHQDKKFEIHIKKSRESSNGYKQSAPRFYEQSSVRSQIYEINDQQYEYYCPQVKNQKTQKLSPFQANNMFKEKDSNKSQRQYKNSSFYDFQTDQNDSIREQKLQFYDKNPYDFPFKNKKRFKNAQDISFQSPNLAIKKDLISDTLQQQQARVICLLQQKKYKFPVQCWIDQMGCLRRKNHTYLFDSQGNVLVTTQSAFKKLCQQNVCKSIF